MSLVSIVHEIAGAFLYYQNERGDKVNTTVNPNPNPNPNPDPDPNPTLTLTLTLTLALTLTLTLTWSVRNWIARSIMYLRPTLPPLPG